MKANLPFIDRIWRVRSSLPLDETVTATEAFEKLDPLFDTYGTEHKVEGSMLSFTKDNPAAQDKMATFTKGTLEVARSESGQQLKYDLSSPALFFSFLAPLLFLCFAQIAVALNDIEGPIEKSEEEKKEEEEKVIELHWLDTMLGAPEPKQPGEDKEEEEGEEEEEEHKHSPTPAYYLAALFAAIYVVGRTLEPWLIKRTFRRALSGQLKLEEYHQNKDIHAVGRSAPSARETE